MRRFIFRPDDPFHRFDPLYPVFTSELEDLSQILLRNPCVSVCACMRACPAAQGSHWPKWECAAAATGHWGLLSCVCSRPSEDEGQPWQPPSAHSQQPGIERNDSQMKKGEKKNHRLNRRLHWLCVYCVCVHLSAHSDASLLRLVGDKKAKVIIWRIQ